MKQDHGLHADFFGRKRVRLVRQTEVAECGLTSLAMVASYHGFEIDLGTLRRQFQPSLRGSTLKSLIAIADQLGFVARAVKLPLEKLDGLHLPAILHWDMKHFVVLEAVRGRKALVHNPEGTSRWILLDEVSHHFTGIALELRPAETFEPVTARSRLRLFQLWDRISGLKRSVLQVFALGAVMQAFVLATPYYMQLAIDDALPALDIEFLALLALGFGLFALLNAAATLLRAFVLLSAGNSLGYGIAVNVSRRLFRLSIEWFEKRHIGDVISRFQSVAPVRQFLTEGATASLVDGSLALATLAVMFVYSPRLAIIAIAAFGLYGLVRMLSFGPQRQAQEEAIVASGREQSTIIETVRGIATFRLFNREAIRHALWQSRLTDSMNAAMSVIRISAWQNAANGLIFSVEMILSIWVGVGMAMAGSLSLGMLFAFISYKAQFLQRGASLIDQIFAFRMMGLHLERLGDIVHAEQDRSFAATQPPRLLRGQVELRQVSFRYSPSDPMVLENVNLVVEPGDHIAITGPSGGGKSTLVKILLGLVEPTEGEVLIDGAPLASFGHRNFRDQTGAVLQDDHLFAGSLFENITLFEDVPDQSAVTRAVEAAALHDDISAMPMGYDTLVGDMGSALSGGQKQRLLLARALYREPRLLVMDEGTSHLDVEREQRVNHFISALGVTRVIIAHRRETILAAERVYSLSAGRLTDVTTVYGVKAV